MNFDLFYFNQKASFSKISKTPLQMKVFMSIMIYYSMPIMCQFSINDFLFYSIKHITTHIT